MGYALAAPIMSEHEDGPPALGSARHLSELIFGGLGHERAHDRSANPSPNLLNFPSPDHASSAYPSMKEYQSADQTTSRTPPCAASFSSSDGFITSPPTRNSSLLDTSSPLRVSTADLNMQHQMVVLPSPTAMARARPAGGRSCLTCGTHSTPKWRGPLGNLCNACGLAERKKRPKAKAPGKAYLSHGIAKSASRPRARGIAAKPSPVRAFSFSMALAYAAPAPAHDYSSPASTSPSPTGAAEAAPPCHRQPRGALTGAHHGVAHVAPPMAAARHPGLGMVHAAPRVCAAATSPALAPNRRIAASGPRTPPSHAPLCFNFRQRMAAPAGGVPSVGSAQRSLVDELADFDLGCDLFMSSDEIERALRVKDDLCAAAGRDQPQHILRPAPPACFVPPLDPMFGINLEPGPAPSSFGSDDLSARSAPTSQLSQWGSQSISSDTVASVFAGNRHTGLSAAGLTGGPCGETGALDDDEANRVARERAIQASAAAAALLRRPSDTALSDSPSHAPKRVCDFDPPAPHSRARQYEDCPGVPPQHHNLLPMLAAEPAPADGGFFARPAEPPFVRAASLPRLDDPWCSPSDNSWDASAPAGFGFSFDACGGAAEAEALSIAGFCVGASA